MFILYKVSSLDSVFPLVAYYIREEKRKGIEKLIMNLKTAFG